MAVFITAKHINRKWMNTFIFGWLIKFERIGKMRETIAQFTIGIVNIDKNYTDMVEEVSSRAKRGFHFQL